MKLVHASFWTAAFASSFMGIALMVPMWLGRKDPDGSTELYGAFYQFICGQEGCETYSRWLNSDAVPLEGKDWGLELAALPGLALIAFLLCFLAVTTLEVVSCRCCGDRLRMRRVLVYVTLLLIISALFSCLTVLIAIYVCSEFYSDNTIDHVEEFPWSVLFFAIASVLVIIAVAMFAAILRQWGKYKDYYGYFDVIEDDYDDRSRSLWSDRTSRSPRKSRFGKDGYTNDGFERESNFTSLSDLRDAKHERGYNASGYPRVGRGAGSVLKSSGKSLNASPMLRRDGRDRIVIRDLTRPGSYNDFIGDRSIDLHRKATNKLSLPPVPWAN